MGALRREIIDIAGINGFIKGFLPERNSAIEPVFTSYPLKCSVCIYMMMQMMI